MYKRFTTIAGRTIITRCTDSSRIKTEKGRKPKTNPTPAAVAKVNRINQERDLTAKLNANFKPEDLWIVLSYPDRIPIEEAMARVEKFKRNIRNRCKKAGVAFRSIEATGIGQLTNKPHHHIVLNAEVTREMITRYWPEEYVHIEFLWSSGNYDRVAKYMLKNAQESKDKRGKNARAYRCSRTIITPQARVEEMKRDMTIDPEDLQPRKGYYIDRDSVRTYWHPITGCLCYEYIEVSLEETPRLSRYSRGRPARREKIYPEYWDEQTIMEEMQGWTLI